jgi:uncharacterized protein with HEPN domain
MLPESSKLLLDIRHALDDIDGFTRGLDLESYSRDGKCRAAVERKFEVMGEACMRLRDRFPDVFEKVPDARQMISFRNRLIHGYDSVDDAIVWDILMRKLPALGRQVDDLL